MKVLRRSLTLAAFISSLTLAACGGGGGSSALPGNTGGTGSQSLTQQTEDSVNTANALGAPVKDVSSYNDTMSSPGSITFAKGTVSTNTAGDGTCHNGVEFFAPDKNNDANSTERIEFYDNACTQIARDAVRIYSAAGAGSETVQRTAKLYAMNAPATPEAVRTESVTISGAQFDSYGFPVVSHGFDRVNTGSLVINGLTTINGDGELVVGASSNNVSGFCSDSAGFNATGNVSQNETFGWQSLNPGGTRTINSDGTVTWALTRTGTAYTGGIGALSIQTGTQNTACPISTPMFTLAGGTAKGTYSIPISATYAHGILSNLTVTNATLVNGDVLNVTTNGGLAPSDPHFISGTLTNGSTAVASFNVNAFGDGYLTVTASGKVYAIEDWHVIRASS